MRASRIPVASFGGAPRASSRPRCPHYLHHRPRPQAQALHTTTPNRSKHRSPYRSITQAELQRIADARAALFPKYTKDELETVRQTYTPGQQRAVELGDEAVDPYDLARAKPRRDALRPKTIDAHSFSRLQPVIDKRPSTARGEWDNYDDNQVTSTLSFLPDEEKKVGRIGELLIEPSDDMYDEGPKDPTTGKPQRDLLSDLWQTVKQGKPQDDQELEDFTLLKSSPDSSATLNRGQEDQARQEIDEDEPASNLPSIRTQRSTPRVVDSDISTGEAEIQSDDQRLLQRLEASLPQSIRDRPRGLTAAQRLENALRWRDHADPPELAQDLPKIHDPRWIPDEESEENEEDKGKGGSGKGKVSEQWARLSKRLGKTVPELMRYRNKMLVQKRVVNVTRLGKIQSLYTLIVVGDENGMVGIGEGKASEMSASIQMAHINAIRAMMPIRRYEKRTIFGEVIGKVSAVELKLSARPPGFGLRCSSYVYEIAKCAGLHDLQAKSLRSRNPMNVCKAMVKGLQEQKDPEDVARARGKKLVDARKVYYAGLV